MIAKYKTFRCKTKCGLSVKWTVGPRGDKWKILGLEDAKRGRTTIPSAFLPFELTNEVFNGPLFDTRDDAEAYARSL